jgi:coenzyme Q-binding protein COQ10
MAVATVETEYRFKGGIEKVFQAITNYQKYAQHLPGVTKVEILPTKTSGAKCEVRFEVNLIKSFHYTLTMFEKKPNEIHWSLVDSNLMKENTGGWKLSKAGDNETLAHYAFEVKFKGLMPSMITDQVAKANLPAMMAGFQKMVDEAT